MGRIGGDNHRRRRESMLKLRIGEVGDALEQREVGHDREREAREHDRLPSDAIGQRAEHDEERRADSEPDRDHDLRGDAGNLQRLGQEEQRVELTAVPHDGFAGGGAEQRKDRDLGVTPLAKGFRERTLGLLALFDHALEQRQFIELEPDPERDREQHRREEERYPPAPIAERGFAHAGADAEDQEEREEKTKRSGGLNPRRVIAAFVRRRMLSDVDRGATIFAAKCEALNEAKRDQHHRRHDSPAGIAREHANEERANAHEAHGDEKGVFATDHVAEMAEDQRAEWAHRKAGRKREQREDKADICRNVGEEIFRQEGAERAVDVKVVPLKNRPQR